MKVFISVPMSGRTKKEIEADIKQAKKDLGLNSKKNVYIHNFDSKFEGTALTGLSEAIKKIDECDAIYMCPGWRKAKGCRIEFAIALFYDIPIYGLSVDEVDNMEVVIRKKYQRKPKAAKEEVKEVKKTKKKNTRTLAV